VREYESIIAAFIMWRVFGGVVGLLAPRALTYTYLVVVFFETVLFCDRLLFLPACLPAFYSMNAFGLC
jgi:hypothetical protein